MVEALQSLIPYDQWIRLKTSGSPPLARYKHAAEVVGDKLYVIGGSRNGRYLGDIQVLDLQTLAWSTLKLLIDQDKSAENVSVKFPPSSGHRLVKWGNSLLVIGGFSKGSSKNVAVRSIDLESYCYSVVNTSGTSPLARGGHSVTLIGSKMVIFGGEGMDGQLLNDLHILDLESMSWSTPMTLTKPPSPRFDHVAAIHAERYLWIFGGCSHSACFSDLHVLDMQTMEWSQPQIMGEGVNSRAGHAAATIGDNWFIVGGGDNSSGALGTIVLNLSKLVWSTLTTVKKQDPIASEGLTINPLSINGELFLVAFGGYNGSYNNEVLVLHPTPRNSFQPKIFQSHAAAAAAASVAAAYALNVKGERKDPIDVKGTSKATDEIDTLSEEIKYLKKSLAETRESNSKHGGDLDERNETYTELSKELSSVQEQLIAERSRCIKLEGLIFDLRKTLELSSSLESELEHIQGEMSTQKIASNIKDVPIQRKKSGGLWQWVAGAPVDAQDM